MFLSSILLAVQLFSLSSAVEVINRTGDLHIVNKQAAPDGLTRWCVYLDFLMDHDPIVIS